MKRIKPFIPDRLKILYKQLFKDKLLINTHLDFIKQCNCCGSTSIITNTILWNDLINQWNLSQFETKYINRQQGTRCKRCKANLRSMSIAHAMMREAGYTGCFKDFVKSCQFKTKRILEVNEAGQLHQYLKIMPNHTLAEYPAVDIQNLPYQDASFDIVVHSDTLEHVPDPILALKECFRVLKPNGYCIFTVPMILDRLTKSRKDLPPSYHGSEEETGDDYLVHTEFGSDVWKYAVESGFSEVRIYSLEYPAAQCVLCKK